MENKPSPATISRGLKTNFIGQKVIYYPCLTSTMDTARQAARGKVAEGTVIIAGEQTGGRGRLKRAWLSPPGNIALSIILYPDTASLPYLVMVASLATVHSIEMVTGLKTQIKWPNDVLINGKKVCGILIENEVKANRIVCAIIGIGINVDLDVTDFHEISAKATSLKEVSGRAVSRIKIIRLLLREFERLYLTLPDRQSIYEAWRDRLATLGKKVTIKWGDATIEGIAESIDETGALIIRGVEGTITKVVAGDVTLREE